MGGRRSPRAKGAEARLPGRLEAEAVAVSLAALALFVEIALLSYQPPIRLLRAGRAGRELVRARGRAGRGRARRQPRLGGARAARRRGGDRVALPARTSAAAALDSRSRAGRLCLLSLAGGAEVLRRAFPEVVSAHAGGALGALVVAPLSHAFYLAGSSLVLADRAGARADGGDRRLAARQRRAPRGEARAACRASSARRCASARCASGAGWRRARTRARRRAEDGGGSRSGREAPAAAEAHADGRRARRRGSRRRARPKSTEPEVVEHRVVAAAPLRQEALPFADGRGDGPYKLPDLDLLARGPESTPNLDRDALIRNSQILEKKLADFSVMGRVVKVHPGPVITMYEFEPAPGVKVSRIVNLSDDLALALRAMSVRIVAPIPGKNVVGIEVPNVERDVVVLRDVVAHASFQETEARIPIALGKDIFGNPLTTDLASMPHLLVAGATGTGKSVFLNALLCSILMRSTPDDVKLLLIDPKMLEFSLYQGIPHLIAEVVTNPKRAAAALLGVVGKMEERYRLMAQKGVRNIEQYNRAVAKDLAANRPKPDDEIVPKKLPYIVVVIDELADLMIVAARDVEESLMRLAQMARAAGIHLVLATQRPSVDVLTGIIKANFPSRISFQVSSRTDSRTVLDANGAERLLGQGDLLHVPPGSSKLERIHGPYISEKEVQAVTEWTRTQGSPEFDPDADPSQGREREDGGARRGARRALRPGARRRRATPNCVDLLRPAQAQDRLQSLGADPRADGGRRRRRSAGRNQAA